MKLKDVLQMVPPEAQNPVPPASESASPETPAPTPRQQPFSTDGRKNGDGWSCPYCGHPVTITDVCLSDDGERTLTLWRCDPCQVVAVTPDAIRHPPTGWVKRRAAISPVQVSP